MSALTKTLVILLTISSIFLCGIVVTYVANADNFKKQNQAMKTELRAAKENQKDAKKQLNETIAKSQRLEDKLNKEMTSLKLELNETQGKLKNVERERAELLAKVNSWTSVVEGFTQTNDQQGLLLKNTLEELNKIQTEQIKERKELSETTSALVEKMAIIKTLETNKKRLVEEISELQNKMDRFLLPVGQTTVPALPVTGEKDKALPTAPVAKDIKLEGLVTAIDLKNSMASISIGKADGVKGGMRFHVTRGDEFICDILIIDIDADEAVGVLELVQQNPKVGDKVSTNL